MEVKVLYKGYCIEIDGQRFRHHREGGGLAGEHTRVADGAHIALDAKVKDYAIIEGDAAIYNHVEVRDRAVIRSGVALAGITVIGGDAEIVSGYINVPYAITSGKVYSGKSEYWGKARKNLILPIEEAVMLEFNKLEEMVDNLDVLLAES